MIIILTGQPNSGKTTLALELVHYLYEIRKEIYLHSSRLREGKMVEYYEPSLNNYLDIDTDKYTIEESIKLITHYIQ